VAEDAAAEVDDDSDCVDGEQCVGGVGEGWWLGGGLLAVVW
jgi:hypothetical protein